MRALTAKYYRHPRREVPGAVWQGTACVEVLTLDGTRPVCCDSRGNPQISGGSVGMVYVGRLALAIATGRDYWEEPAQAFRRCDLQRCVNPAHMVWLPAREHPRRAAGLAAGRAVFAARAKARRIPVISMHLDTGDWRYFSSLEQAAATLRLEVRSISRVTRGEGLRTGRYTFDRFDPTNPYHVVTQSHGRLP